MAFPDLAPDLKSRMPSCAAGSCRTSRSRRSPGSRRARRRCCSEDEADLSYFLANLPADIPVTVVGLGSIVVEQRACRSRHPARPGTRSRSRASPSRRAVPASGWRAPRRDQRSPGSPSCAAFPAPSGGALRGQRCGREDQRMRSLRRGVDRFQRGAGLFKWRHAYQLPPVPGARRCHLHRGTCLTPGDQQRSPRRNGRSPDRAEATADQESRSGAGAETHARPQGLAAIGARRRRGLPSAARGLADALQLPGQSAPPPPPTLKPGRDGAKPCKIGFGRRADEVGWIGVTG